MFKRFLIAAPLLLTFSAQTVMAQECPSAATAARLAKASVADVTTRGMSASSEERGQLVSQARAYTILAWSSLGLNGLQQNKGGVNLLASCMGNGGCGFTKTPTAPIYAFINSGSVPAILRAPPPAAAVQWAKEKLGCLASQIPGQTPAQTPARTQAQAQPTVPTANSTPRRSPPRLVPKGPAPADLAKTQKAIEVIDERCHSASTKTTRIENCLMLARSFRRGIQGYAYDTDSATYYNKRTCDEGNAEGCLGYGSHYRQWGKTESEKQMGTEYVGKACDLGDEGACFNYKAWTGKDRK